jgi:hypothetical protein
MPAQSDSNIHSAPTCYTLTYKDGYKDYVWCHNDKVAVDYAMSTIGTNGFSDVVSVTRTVDDSIVRVWWNK